MIEYTEGFLDEDFPQILNLYEAVGWVAYTKNPASLRTAFQNPTYVCVAKEEHRVVGCVRSISDDVSIHYLQDILVHPTMHRRGVGRRLIQTTLHRFSPVRTHLLLTDDEEKQKQFYTSVGYHNTRELQQVYFQ